MELKRLPPEYFYCAKCDAESGNECKTEDGDPTSTPHKDRWAKFSGADIYAEIIESQLNNISLIRGENE
jgi:hypothetical protein